MLFDWANPITLDCCSTRLTTALLFFGVPSSSFKSATNAMRLPLLFIKWVGYGVCPAVLLQVFMPVNGTATEDCDPGVWRETKNKENKVSACLQHFILVFDCHMGK